HRAVKPLRSRLSRPAALRVRGPGEIAPRGKPLIPGPVSM
ncbi:hypothetical protein AZZ86_001567, partial [Klebsiella pneumoniae]